MLFEICDYGSLLAIIAPGPGIIVSEFCKDLWTESLGEQARIVMRKYIAPAALRAHMHSTVVRKNGSPIRPDKAGLLSVNEADELMMAEGMPSSDQMGRMAPAGSLVRSS